VALGKDPEGVTPAGDGVRLGVALAAGVESAVTEALALAVQDAEAVAFGVALPLTVAVADPVVPGVAVPLPVTVAESVLVAD
jgi:hypothetical protein